MALMDDVLSQVQRMDEGELRAQLAEIKAKDAERREKNKLRTATMTDEEKSERRERNKAYREQHKEKFTARMKEYNLRPDVKEKRQAYMKTRNARNKAILARAKELGLLS